MHGQLKWVVAMLTAKDAQTQYCFFEVCWSPPKFWIPGTRGHGSELDSQRAVVCVCVCVCVCVRVCVFLWDVTFEGNCRLVDSKYGHCVLFMSAC